jgi:hypothetical protein
MAAPPSNTQPFPELGTPLVDANGAVSIPWYRFFVSLWQKTGGAGLITTGVYFAIVNGLVVAYQALSKAKLGTLVMSSSAGAAAQSLTLTASPQVYTATIAGTFFTNGGQLSISRDGGASWFIFSVTGGAVPMLNADKVKVVWEYSPPLAQFLPVAAA